MGQVGWCFGRIDGLKYYGVVDLIEGMPKGTTVHVYIYIGMVPGTDPSIIPKRTSLVCVVGQAVADAGSP